MFVSFREHSPDTRINAIIDAVADKEMHETSAWEDLDALSTQTQVDGVEIPADAIILDRTGGFRGLMTIYVVLNYGPDQGDDGFTETDAFRGFFTGHFKGDQPVIDDITADTSPFYSGSEDPP